MKKADDISTVWTYFRTVNPVLSGLDAYKRHLKTVQDRGAKSHGCAPESAISEQIDLLLHPGGIHARGVCMNEES